MRRLLTFVVVMILGASPLTVRSQGAQEVGPESWVDVARPTSGASLGLLDNLEETLAGSGIEEAEDQVEELGLARAELEARFGPDSANAGYVVSFLEPLTHVPEMDEGRAEWMAVFVQSGEFVLDNVGTLDFIVVPGDARESIGTFDREPAVGGDEVIYTLEEEGMPCPTLCTVTPPRAVQALENDWIVAQRDDLCVWCLLNQNANSGQSTGILYVYPLLEEELEFSWIESWDKFQGGQSQAMSPDASRLALAGSDPQAPLVGAMGWAMFNPAGKCRGN